MPPTIRVVPAGHVVYRSHPKEVAALIEQAAQRAAERADASHQEKE
jgi:hypothetical protein